MRRFYQRIGVAHLGLYLAANIRAMLAFGVVGLPTTILIDRAGRERGPFAGPAQRDSAEALAQIQSHINKRSQEIMQETTSIAVGARNLPIRLPLGRRSLILSAMTLIAAGLALNWSWLTAVGAAPVILALAPCAVMCGLGLCITGGSKSCGNKSNPAGEPESKDD